MKRFNYKEIDTITNTPITSDCFDMENFVDVEFGDEDSGKIYIAEVWEMLLVNLERLRKKYNETKDREYFNALVKLMPNTYKLVNLRGIPSYTRKQIDKYNATEHHKKYNKKYYKKNKEQIFKHQKEYRERNKEVVRERRRKYREEHKELLREKQRQFYKKHREEILAKHRKYYSENPEKFRQYNKTYYEKHKNKKD